MTDTLEQLAQIEDKSTTNYANNKTPGSPFKKGQKTKGHNTKRTYELKKEDGVINTEWETDDFSNGSDVNRTVWKKSSKASTEARLAVQALWNLQPMKLVSAEEEEHVKDHGNPDQDGKAEVVKGGSRKQNNRHITKGKAVGKKANVTEPEEPDTERESAYLILTCS